MMSCSSFPFIEKCLYCSLLYVMSIVLKPSNNITLFSLKKTSFVTRVLSVCKMVVRILSLPHPLLGELTVTLSTNMAVWKAHMASLLKSYKTTLQHRHALFVLFRNGVYRWLIDTEGSLIYLSASFELLSSLLR